MAATLGFFAAGYLRYCPVGISNTKRVFAVKASRLISLSAGVVTLCLFVGLTFSNGVVRATDSQLALSMNSDKGVAFTAIMVAASRYGREYFWIGVLGMMIVFGNRETRLMTIELALLFGVGIVAGEIAKHLLYKPRPFMVMTEIVTRVPKEYDSSFPSGHALIVAIGSVFSLLKFRRKAVTFLLILEAALVAYSRAYVGMHYPLDVIAGIFLGSAIAFLGSFVSDKGIRLCVGRTMREKRSGSVSKAALPQ